jgi:dihydroorotase
MNDSTLTLIKPDDWHCHLRDGVYLQNTVPDLATRFARAVIMPNLQPPITTVAQAIAYRDRILAQVPTSLSFEPLMTLYLTENMTIQELQAAKQSANIIGCKLYPAHATTHSAAGIQDLQSIYHLFEAMERLDLPLLIHGEVVDPSIDIFDREAVFIERELTPLSQRFPKLRMVLEHISSQRAVEFVLQAPATVAATITLHHLLINRNELLAGGIKPHYYCAPIVKTMNDQLALQQAALSGNPKFFLGTDSAPHPKKQKENACGCAGIYTAHCAIELCATFFEEHKALTKLEAFVSLFGAKFYRLPANQKTITLNKQAWEVPKQLAFGDDQLIPFYAGQTIPWKLNHHENK